MICKHKGCNRDTEFDIDEWCNYCFIHEYGKYAICKDQNDS